MDKTNLNRQATANIMYTAAKCPLGMEFCDFIDQKKLQSSSRYLANWLIASHGIFDSSFSVRKRPISFEALKKNITLMS
jgi:hypothetical protein